MRRRIVDFLSLPQTFPVMTILVTLRRTAVLTAVLLFGSVAYAQQSNAIERVAEHLNLSDSQIELVRSHLASEQSPESVWQLSAALAPTLSNAQQARLDETAPRMERREREARLSADRPQRQAREHTERPEREARRDQRRSEVRGERSAQRDDARSTLRSEALSGERQSAMRAQRDAHQSARNAALNLSAEQISRLEARRSERTSTSMRDILTEDQITVWKLQRVLSRTIR